MEEALGRGDARRASALAEDALQRFPHEPAALWGAALVRDVRGDLDGAAFLLRRMLEGPGTGAFPAAEVHGWLGDLLFARRRYAESLPHLLAGRPTTGGGHREALAVLAGYLPPRLPEVVAPREPAEILLLGPGHQPMVRARVGGKRLTLALDTGSSWTVLAEGAAAGAGAAVVAFAEGAADGRGASFGVRYAVAPEVEVAGIAFGPRPVAVLEEARLLLRDPVAGGGEPLEGLLGLDLLGDLKVEVHRGEGWVRLAAPDPSPEGDECLWQEGRLLAPVRVEGVDLWFLVDTGASHTTLTEEGLARVPGARQRAAETLWRVLSPGGLDVAVREATAAWLEAGGLRFPARVLPILPRHVRGRLPVHGVLGADLLLEGRMVLQQGRLALALR